jgi:hypothetical protein
MRHLLVALLVLGVAGVAYAATTTPNMPTEMKDVLVGSNPAYDGRDGGETIADAVVIPSLPFSDTGATCDNINDYDEACPYTGSTSADVVYAYTPAANQVATFDLCYSQYDTKIYIYDSVMGLVGCNDDAHFDPPCYTYSSMLEDIPLMAGETYYIVIDGYGGDCGTYQLDVFVGEECIVECPAGALEEGEPTLVDEYLDNYNGGCNSTPFVFQTLEPQADNCLTMCAISGWYLFQGSQYRDTDWFEVTAAGGMIDYTVTPEFPMQLFVLNTDCGNIVLLYDLAVAECTSGTISFNATAGDMYWLWAGPQDFAGPVYEFDYVIDLCGIGGGVIPTVETTWGGVKNTYK